MMSWPEHMDPALRDYIVDRQNRALAVYESDPALLREHVGQEDSFRVGGYGTRQISELLQNAVDAITASGKPGKVEFRLADGALYCANEGQAFSLKGLEAVTYAFLSPKEADEIGRFGLGFKSVLGITENPQIFSRSVSFEFNSPTTAELFSSLEYQPPRLPLLRIPSEIDPHQVANEDRNLAEMMTWATSVVKIPIAREYPRILKELSEFKSASLVFFKGMDALRVSLRPTAEADLISREFTRQGSHDEGEIRIVDDAGEVVRWLYAERDYSPTEAALTGLRATARRESMTVSYALSPDGRAQTGQLWAWFPLEDKTTASGIFNAPWEINDDRTSLLPGSTLNKELLEVSADLFLDVAMRLSTPADPARHLEAFPARGREVRGQADRFLTEQIPERAKTRPSIPNGEGALKVPTYFKRVPDLVKTPVNSAAVKLWQDATGQSTMPHHTCFTSPTRRARLRSLFGGSEDEQSKNETTIAAWLEDLRPQGLTGAVTAVEILLVLKEPFPQSYRQGLHAQVIPTSLGTARVSACDRVLIPLRDAPAPDGVEVVSAELADIAAGRLRELGFRNVSGDQTAAALGNAITATSHDEEWSRLWGALNVASPATAIEVIGDIRARNIDVKLPTEDEQWRSASSLLTDARRAPGVPSRHVSSRLVPNMALRTAAGTVSEPTSGYDLRTDDLFEAYQRQVENDVRKQLAATGETPNSFDLAVTTGIGPIDILGENLDDSDREKWSMALIRKLPRVTLALSLMTVSRKKITAEIPAMEWWALMQYGLVRSTHAFKRPHEVVASNLNRFGAFLPVAITELPGIPIPHMLRAVPDGMLREFLGTADFALNPAHMGAFMELMREASHRASIARPTNIPAVVGGYVVLCPASDVAVSETAEQETDLSDAGVPYLPARGEFGELISRWELLPAELALHQSVEITGEEDAVALVDLHPSLADLLPPPLLRTMVARALRIERVLQSSAGTRRFTLLSSKDDRLVVVDASLSGEGVLEAVSRELQLGLTAHDITRTIQADDDLRRSELIARAQATKDDRARLVTLVGERTLRKRLPDGLLPAVEESQGQLNDVAIAELFLYVYGKDALRELRDDLVKRGVPVPDRWDGKPAAQAAVKRLGFDTSFAGSTSKKPAPVTMVQGRIELNPLHDYQQEVADKIGDLVRSRTHEGRRGLLYLPTGAGKTRVTVEAIVRLMMAGEVPSPLLWIAQSEELCEQAISSFTEVWRWIGDERSLDISRFWSGYEVDESNEELQVVVAIDDTLNSRLGEPHYDWLAKPGMVVIDEAHTAGSKAYTDILRHLGLTSTSTARPLLGLTATPFRGRNDEVNRLFAQRFGNNRLESLDPENAIMQLREKSVLSEVDYEVLPGAEVLVTEQDAEFRRMKEVSRTMLATIGQNMTRTRTVIDHIKSQDSAWPILVFAASVASAHTIAALLRVEGVRADSVDGGMRRNERRRVIERFKSGETQVLVNCDLLTQGFDAPQVRALYIARPTFSPNRYIQMVGRGLRGPANGGTDRCLIVNVEDTFEQFGEDLAYNEFDYLWSAQ